MQSPFWERLLFVLLIPCVGGSLVYVTAQPKNPLGYILLLLSVAIELALWQRDKKRQKKTHS